MEIHHEYFHEVPKFDDLENANLAYASSKIKMRFKLNKIKKKNIIQNPILFSCCCFRYSKSQGRYIVANTNIRRGDILFIEKAFIFAPVFKENKEFFSFKCYHCLRDIISSVPCTCCTLCVYCNEYCRDQSWDACHRWECNGMQANIWYDLGIAFPAFKAMLKGIGSGFQTLEGGYEGDLKCFGDKNDNYRYFNRLVSNIYKNKNVAPYIVVSAFYY